MHEQTAVSLRHCNRSFWLLLLLLIGIPLLGRQLLPQAAWAGYVQGFSMMFISILLEALPFVLLGTLVSSMLHLYLREDVLARLLPKRHWLGLSAAALLGFLFPVCECAIVPITRGLVRKGVPVGMAVAFLLAVPIVNPIVLASTHYAFGGAWGVVLLRATCGFLVAVFVGDYLGRAYTGTYPLRSVSFYEEAQDHDHGNACTHAHGCSQTCQEGNPSVEAIWQLLYHTNREFFAVGRYLIIGAGLSAALQTLVPRQWLMMVGQNNLLSVIALMALAYCLSPCSEADAFIARTFVGQFSGGSILAFLVLGPMLDLKGTLLLAGAFERRFVWRLAITVTLAVLGLGLLANAFHL